MEAEPAEEETKETMTGKMKEDAQQEPIAAKEAAGEVVVAQDPTPQENIQQLTAVKETAKQEPA